MVYSSSGLNGVHAEGRGFGFGTTWLANYVLATRTKEKEKKKKNRNFCRLIFKELWGIFFFWICYLFYVKKCTVYISFLCVEWQVNWQTR